MQEFNFDNSKKIGHPNANRNHGQTVRGKIELYPRYAGLNDILSLDIRGPGGAPRGAAALNREDARRVGLALLKWGIGS